LAEKIHGIKKSNQLLLDKLVEISKGKWSSVVSHVGSPITGQKSLNYHKKKKEAERIDNENQRLMQRIIK
jgi:hypothetical protein